MSLFNVPFEQMKEVKTRDLMIKIDSIMSKLMGSLIINRSADLLLQPSKLISDDNSSIDSFDGVEFHLYLFANPLSGSQKAKRYTQLGFSNCTVDLGQNMRAITHVFNVIDKNDCQRGLKKLGKRQYKSKFYHNYSDLTILRETQSSCETYYGRW